MIETKIVYVPINEDWDIDSEDYTLCDSEGEYLKNVKNQELITFTSEEYNKHIEEVIKDALNKYSTKEYFTFP